MIGLSPPISLFVLSDRKKMLPQIKDPRNVPDLSTEPKEVTATTNQHAWLEKDEDLSV